MAQVDNYCERIDPSFWAEPVNALTNLAFILAGLFMWRRVGAWGTGRLLSLILIVIGCGSWAFHTQAQVWAGVADVVPILAFILVYLYLANRAYWSFSPWLSAGLVLLFVPYAAAVIPVAQLVPGLGSSASYVPVPILIGIYAVLLRQSAPGTARGLVIGAAILSLSILMRSLDMPLCAQWPLGTHFLWHILNAVMLAWMIEVYRRHILAAPRAGR